jgi:hypothetical protein
MIKELWNSATNVISKNLNLIVLIISLFILIALTKYIYAKKKEREGFGIEDIGKLFEMIPMIFDMIGKLATTLFDFIDIFTCPFKILFNLPTCLPYYGLDVLFIGVWYIVWGIVFVFVFVPVFIGNLAVCISLSNWNLCCRFSYDDVCPSKHTFFNFVENIYEPLAGGRLLYRNRDDLDTCYCLPPIKMALNPLTNYRSYSGVSAEGGNTSARIAIIIIIGLAITHYSMKHSTSK